MIRGSLRIFEWIDVTRTGRRIWLAALVLYGVGIGVDIACHLADDLSSGNRMIEYSEVAVAFSAGLFWPVDIVATALLKMQ
jgi:hypothetical protein